MNSEHAFQASASETEQPHGDSDRADRPFQVGDVLPRRMCIADMCRAFPIDGHVMDRSTFHRHQKAGRFDRFELRPQIGAKAWSGTLVARYLDCEAGASRFVTVGVKSHARQSAVAQPLVSRP